MPATAPRSRSRRKPKGEGHFRREEILTAAEGIFVDHGYEGATIRKIADAVGLSSTALYMHFPDKAAILHEICKEAFQALTRAQDVIMEADLPPEQRLRRLIESYIAFGFDNPNAYRLIYLTRPQEAEGAKSAAQEVGIGLFRAFETVVHEVDAAGRLKIPPRTAAQVIWAGGHGVVSLLITKPYFDWVEREALVKATLDAVFDGLIRA
ncbi:MAG: TetR/AcrR family transcriptional regulator [Brevundimonas sp.]|uniref:TetR/AcrR family transcriptional regulator n=1 Tax=Brevundimonas sp. TaxID=1871086 RepID=UPI00273299E6|nr:TetR/AcrR family transcriptional regulator [Brevundimonas sp.]MDP3378155.1 TetR/AcrR family transcriptional regulator [Brevundimonas sp.]